MSAYTDITAIQAEIPQNDLIALVDDVGTGMMDALATSNLDQIISNASSYIDSKISNIYDTPLNPVPESVASMALTIVCYRLYRRRQVPDERNKFYNDFNDVRTFLNQVNSGDMKIDLSISRDFSPVEFTSRSSIYGTAGSNYLNNTM